MEKCISFISDIKSVDISACEKSASFLQSAMWGEFKSRFGWTAGAFLIKWTHNEDRETALLALSRKLISGFSFTYVPWGPQLPDDFSGSRAQALAELGGKLKPFLARNTAFIRFEPPWFTQDAESEAALLLRAGLKRAAAVVQPPDTVLINLESSCEEILNQMKPKWRYNISLAGKKGVQIKSSGAQELEIFYALLKETSARDGLAIHGFNYYKTLFELCDENSLRLYTASHEGDNLAAIVVLFWGKSAVYLYGASSNVKRNLMAPSALQWKAMQDAKDAGCKYYDLYGIAPNDDPNHPMAGLYRFKTGFGGQIMHRPGGWDFPYKPAVYALFNKAESLRKKLRDRRKRTSN